MGACQRRAVAEAEDQVDRALLIAYMNSGRVSPKKMVIFPTDIYL